MAITYSRERPALLLVDLYNDFLSEGGKIYPRLTTIADGVGLLDNLGRIHGAAREELDSRSPSYRTGTGNQALTA